MNKLRKTQGHALNPQERDLPTPPNVPLLRALWPLLDGIGGRLKSTWGVLVGASVNWPDDFGCFWNPR